MASTSRLTDHRNQPPSVTAAGNGDWQTAIRSHNRQPTEDPGRRRFDRDRGFWLGGAMFGAGGCLFGASLPCELPVAVVASVLWWGIYIGCFGMSIGALLGLWAERTQ